DTYYYFGEPIYEYSHKDGIKDGILTPYKVKRITTNIDEYRPILMIVYMVICQIKSMVSAIGRRLLPANNARS
ncbi:hypothetical protein NAH09_12985, partial [Francisella tularensis subsp. holarctica]